MLNQLPKATQHKKKRVGRGTPTGKGKTAGRGVKGQHSRNGKKNYFGFEGGQTRLAKRTPRLKGMGRRQVKTVYQVVNLSQLSHIEVNIVDKTVLRAAGLIANADQLVKLLGNGEIKAALTITVDAASVSAISKIEKSGGKVVLLASN